MMLLNTITGTPPNGELGQVTKEAFEDSVGVLGVKSEQPQEGQDQTKKKNWNGIWFYEERELVGEHKATCF